MPFRASATPCGLDLRPYAWQRVRGSAVLIGLNRAELASGAGVPLYLQAAPRLWDLARSPRFSQTIKIEISAGETPEILEA